MSLEGSIGGEGLFFRRALGEVAISEGTEVGEVGAWDAPRTGIGSGRDCALADMVLCCLIFSFFSVGDFARL